MNKEHIKGTVNEIKGRAKEEYGHATGNTQVEGEGLFNRVKGRFQKEVGDLKDAVKHGIDKVLEKKDK